jgi:hypothetical protein
MLLPGGENPKRETREWNHHKARIKHRRGWNHQRWKTHPM